MGVGVSNDPRHLVKALRKSGFDVEQSKGTSHWRVSKNGDFLFMFSATPSDPKWHYPVKRWMRSLNIKIPGWTA